MPELGMPSREHEWVGEKGKKQGWKVERKPDESVRKQEAMRGISRDTVDLQVDGLRE